MVSSLSGPSSRPLREAASLPTSRAPPPLLQSGWPPSPPSSPRPASRPRPEAAPMNPRTARLRQESLDAVPTISAERALLLTEFYRENLGRLSTPLLRAKSFRDLCARKTLYLG